MGSSPFCCFFLNSQGQNFEKLDKNWTFVADKGAIGNLDLMTRNQIIQAKLIYDITQKGSWVGAEFQLKELPQTAVGFSFKVKCSGSSSIWAFISDSTGNRFEYRLCRTLTELDEAQWQNRFLSFDALPDSIKGDKKAIFKKNKIKSIAIVVEPRMDPWYPSCRWIPEPKGEMWFSEVKWVTNYSESIELLAKNKNSIPSSGIWKKTGVCIHSLSEKEFQGNYSLPSVGFSIVRNDLRWNDVEKTKGVYDFSEFDKKVAIAEAHSIHTIIILCSSNQLYNEALLPPVTQPQIDAFTRFCGAAAKYFKGRNVSFEIWNEPNYKIFWKPMPNALNFANLLRPAIDSIRNNNLEVKIISGGTAGIDWRYIDSLGVKGALKGLDGIGFHPYRHGSPESFSDDLACQRWILKKYFNVLPEEWSTESGSSSSWYGNGLSDSTLLIQASCDVRVLLSSWMAGFEASLKYELYARGDSIDDEANYGIVSPDFKPRPSYFALKTLRNYTENRIWQGRLKYTNPNAYALQFDGKDDKILILWTSAGKLDKDIPGYKTRFELQQKPLAVYNYLGEKILVPKKENGKWTIEVAGEPTYIQLPSN